MCQNMKVSESESVRIWKIWAKNMILTLSDLDTFCSPGQLICINAYSYVCICTAKQGLFAKLYPQNECRYNDPACLSRTGLAVSRLLHTSCCQTRDDWADHFAQTRENLTDQFLLLSLLTAILTVLCLVGYWLAAKVWERYYVFFPAVFWNSLLFGQSVAYSEFLTFGGKIVFVFAQMIICLLYTSPSPRD